MVKKVNGVIVMLVVLLVLFIAGLAIVMLSGNGEKEGLRVVDHDWSVEKLSFFWPARMDSVDRIEMRRADGYHMQIDDPSLIRAWLDETGEIEVTREPNPEPRVGCLYRISVYAGEKRVLALSPASVDGNVFVVNEMLVASMHRLWAEGERIKKEREAASAIPEGWPEEWLTHESRKFGFAVDYPASWPALMYGEDVLGGEGAVHTFESSPDAGIRLQVAGREEAWIDIFGQHGTLSVPHSDDEMVSAEDFVTESGLEGRLILYESDDHVELLYYIAADQLVSGRFLGTMAKMSKELYEDQEAVLHHILASLRLVE